MARKIVVTSGKGGVGKTTIVANLGFTLARCNLKVMLIDIDLGLNNLDVVMGIENKIVYDIVDVIEGKCRPRQALVQDFFVPNLYIFPSIHTCSNINITSREIKMIIEELDELFDYILIDCPAGIDAGFKRAVGSADECIVVTTPHISAVRDCDKVINILNAFDIRNTQLIVNRARGDLMVDGDMMSIETIKNFLNIDLLGVVPEDDNVSCQLLLGGAVNKSCDIVTSFEYIVEKLHNGKNLIFDCTKKYRGVLGSIRKNIKRIV